MAEVSSVRTAFVVDTSYLLELYKVPGSFDPERSSAVKKRFETSSRTGCLLFIPLPVIFEVANSIGHIRDNGIRADLANRFVDAVMASFEPTGPFAITPAIEQSHIEDLLTVFKKTYAMKGLGLTDTSVVAEAKRLKEKFGGMYRVHIWTLDRALKGQEPDTEMDPFIG